VHVNEILEENWVFVINKFVTTRDSLAQNFPVLSILFINKDFDTYVFCFTCLPSINMAKSIYGL
jgi:hypothetical protein